MIYECIKSRIPTHLNIFHTSTAWQFIPHVLVYCIYATERGRIDFHGKYVDKYELIPNNE